PARCAIGSIKTNLGHLDTAAGVAGLIKAALSLGRGALLPSLHVEQPNAALSPSSPFHVSTALRPWPAGPAPRRAGVSSFGIGGTNAHVVLEEPGARPPAAGGRSWQVLLVSARTAAARDE